MYVPKTCPQPKSASGFRDTIHQVPTEDITKKISLKPLTRYRLSGQTVFEGFSVGLAGANPASRETPKKSAARSVRRLFFCGSRLQNLAQFKRKKVCSFDSRGLKCQSIPTSHSRNIPFFRIGTYLVRQAVAIDSDFGTTDRDLTGHICPVPDLSQ